MNSGIAGIGVAQAQFMQGHFPKTEVGDAVDYRADRSATEGVFPDTKGRVEDWRGVP